MGAEVAAAAAAGITSGLAKIAADVATRRQQPPAPAAVAPQVDAQQ